MIHHIKRATRHLIFWSLIAIAISLTVVRVALYWVDDYKSELAGEMSLRVGAPVNIGSLSTNMRGFNPQLVLNAIDVLPSTTSVVSKTLDKPVITLKEIRVGVNLLNLVMTRDFWSSSWVTLVGLKLEVKRKEDGSIGIVGLKASGDAAPLWLLQGGKYEVLQSTVTFRDEKNHSKALVLNNVDIAIINTDDRHRINVLTNLSSNYGKSLRVSIDVKGNIFSPAAIDGKAYMEGSGINLPPWVTVDLPLAIELKAGEGNFKLWTQWQSSQLTDATGEISLQHVELARKGQDNFVSDKLLSRFSLQLTSKQMQLTVSDLLLETHNKNWTPAIFTIKTVNATDNSLAQLALYIEQANLQKVAPLIQFFAPLTADQSTQLKQAQPKGTVQNLTLFSDLTRNQFSINGEFTDLGVSPVLSIPGVDNVTGFVAGNDQRGQLQLAIDKTQLSFPSLFAEALPKTTLQGILGWQQTTDNWIFSTNTLSIIAPPIQTNTRLRLTFPKNGGSPFIDLQTAFNCDDAHQIPRFLPTKVMSKTLTPWLNAAFVSGSFTQGGLLIYGKVSDFPYKHGLGVFEVLFKAEQIELDFHPDWPHLKGLQGEVLFLGDVLKVNLTAGSSDKITIKPTEIIIPSLEKGELVTVTGEFKAKILDALTYLQQTPLDLPIAKVLDAITPEGETTVKLSLKVPLEDYIPGKVNGAAQFTNAKLTVNSIDLLIKEMNGSVKFTEQGVFSEGINANALNQAIKIKINNDVKQTTVNVTGKVDVGELKRQLKLPNTQISKGTTDYSLQLNLPYNATPQLNVESKLVGVSLNLPDDLAKTSEQSRLLQFSIDLGDGVLLPLNINYDNKMQAVLNLETKTKELYSGDILIGEGKVMSLPKIGLRLTINRERLALQNWVISDLSKSEDRIAKAGSTLNEVNIYTRQGYWNNTNLGALTLNLKLKGQDWLGNISSGFAKGEFKIPTDLPSNHRIMLDMKMLNLAALEKFKSADKVASKVAPDFMPLISLTSQQTLWNNIELGKLIVENDRIVDGVVFKRIDLQGDKHHLSLTGDWRHQGSTSKTQLAGSLKVIEAGKYLAKLGITHDLAGSDSMFDIHANWQGLPQQFSLEKLQGQLGVTMTHGRILSIEPGFGRILGVLAMAQWTSRLQLDFSDIYQEGLTFDSTKGEFDLADGKAITHNLIIDAIPAKITIDGNVDLLKENLDFIIYVAPKSADAIPIAGTIIGKITSVIEKALTGKDRDGFFLGSQYQVKGTWKEAKVIPLTKNDGLILKIWNALSNFPWM